MDLYGTSVLFVCRLCKASFEIIDDFIEHKKKEHFVEFRTSNCIVFEDVLILKTNNDDDEDEKKCGTSTLSTVGEEDSAVTVPWKEIPNVLVSSVFGNENGLTNFDPPDLSYSTQHIQHDQTDSFDRFPISTRSIFENGDSHNNTSYQGDNKAEVPDLFLQENYDEHDAFNSSDQASADVSFNFIEPKTELSEFESDRGISKTASVESIPFPQNPYVLLKKLSPKEIQIYSRILRNQETTNAEAAEVTWKSQCKLCLKKFNSEADLQIHSRVCILDSSSWYRYCVPCSKFFNSKRARIIHQIRQHGAEGEGWNLLKFKCHVCQKHYSRKYLLANHMESHKARNARSKPFKCNQCSASFFSRYDFTRHQATHTSKRPFKCPEPDCGKAFKLKVCLTKHLKCVHSNIVELFSCPEPNCTSAFKYKANFEKHFKTFHTRHENTQH